MKYYLNRKEVLEAQKEFLKANENEIFKNVLISAYKKLEEVLV